MPPRSSKNSFP